MANIAITNFCNLKCPYCFADDMICESKQNITIEQFKKILSWIARTPKNHIGIIGGEPTLHPYFKDILHEVNIYCRDVQTRARRMYNKNLYEFPDQMALRDAGDPEPMDETYNYMEDYRTALYKPAILHFSSRNVAKIYNRNVLEGYWWKHNPAFQYIKDGLDLIKTIH